jgi:hypothetical protein
MDSTIAFNNYEILQGNPEYIILQNTNCGASDRHIIVKSAVSSVTMRRTHSWIWIVLGALTVLTYDKKNDAEDDGIVIFGLIILLIQLYMYLRKRLIVVAGIYTFEAKLNNPDKFLRWFTNTNAVVCDTPLMQFDSQL